MKLAQLYGVAAIILEIAGYDHYSFICFMLFNFWAGVAFILVGLEGMKNHVSKNPPPK